MAGEIRIEAFWRHPERVSRFALLYEREWPDWYGPSGPGNAAETLRAAGGKERLPVGLVALVDGAPAGTVILGRDSAVGARYPGPWVSSLYVLPEWRGQGLAMQLITAAEKAAVSYGFREVYIGVTKLEDAVLKRGYEPLVREQHGGAGVAILKKRLQVPSRSGE